MPKIRECQAEAFYKTPLYKRIRARYKVTVTGQEIGHVYVEVFTPAEGIAQRNENRVLIDLHGGAFTGGSRINSHMDSIPIAALGRIKVISIDYRMAPEYSFPAASEDVAAVYRELIKTYKPKNIGMYGCSAGGTLAAEAIAWFEKYDLPLPGAVGMLCGSAANSFEGDSAYIGNAISGGHAITADQLDYFRNVDWNDPLVFPARSDQVMARFLASLLISSMRDPALSGVVYTHSRLIALGVDADLHMWDGLGHAFLLDPDFPESQEANAVIVRFFDEKLGK